MILTFATGQDRQDFIDTVNQHYGYGENHPHTTSIVEVLDDDTEDAQIQLKNSIWSRVQKEVPSAASMVTSTDIPLKERDWSDEYVDEKIEREFYKDKKVRKLANAKRKNRADIRKLQVFKRPRPDRGSRPNNPVPRNRRRS